MKFSQCISVKTKSNIFKIQVQVLENYFSSFIDDLKTNWNENLRFCNVSVSSSDFSFGNDLDLYICWNWSDGCWRKGRKQKKSKSPRKESERKNEPVAEAEEEPEIRQKTEQLLSDASASVAGAVKFQITNFKLNKLCRFKFYISINFNI